MSITGHVFEIKRFAVHDGDGIRTTVFLKGCPLKCVWCHNPEGIAPQRELGFYMNRCIGCGDCATVCPVGAHTFADGQHRFDRAKCIGCGKCAAACLGKALVQYGRAMTVEEVLAEVLEDRSFYESSGGGLTLSGGEPTLQPAFTLALLKAAKAAGLNTALDTCGLAPQRIYADLLPWVDAFLYDIKHITAEGHTRCTGQGNHQILENLRYLAKAGANIEVRIPLIPGFNDDEATLRGIAALLDELHIVRRKVLPYHPYARGKYEALGLEDTLPEHIPEAAEMAKAEAILLDQRGASHTN